MNPTANDSQQHMASNDLQNLNNGLDQWTRALKRLQSMSSNSMPEQKRLKMRKTGSCTKNMPALYDYSKQSSIRTGLNHLTSTQRSNVEMQKLRIQLQTNGFSSTIEYFRDQQKILTESLRRKSTTTNQSSANQTNCDVSVISNSPNVTHRVRKRKSEDNKMNYTTRLNESSNPKLARVDMSLNISIRQKKTTARKNTSSNDNRKVSQVKYTPRKPCLWKKIVLRQHFLATRNYMKCAVC
ncbi:uncharacterized protein LOC120341416 [Styela clava]